MQGTRQTRILATLGPVSDTEKTIGALLDAGTNLFRLNMSHAKHDWVRSVAGHIRAAAAARMRAGHRDGFAGAGHSNR